MSQWSEPSQNTSTVQENYRLWLFVLAIMAVIGAAYLFIRWNPFSWGGTTSTAPTGGGSIAFVSNTVQKVPKDYPEHAAPASTNHVADHASMVSATTEASIQKEMLSALQALQAGQAAQTMAIAALHERLQHQNASQGTTTPKVTAAEREAARKEAVRAEEERIRKLQEWKPKVWQRTEDKEKRSEIEEAVDGVPDPFRLNAGWEIPIAIEGQMTSMARGGTRFWVTRDVKDSATGEHILLPQDSYGMLEGQGRVLMGDERMEVVTANFMSWPDGTPIKLGETSVADVTGMPGFADLLDRRLLPNLAAALMTGVLRLGTSVPLAASSQGIAERAGVSVGSEVAQKGSEQVRQSINTSPRMTVRNAYAGVIWLKKPMQFAKAYVR